MLSDSSRALHSASVDPINWEGGIGRLESSHNNKLPMLSRVASTPHSKVSVSSFTTRSKLRNDFLTFSMSVDGDTNKIKVKLFQFINI